MKRIVKWARIVVASLGGLIVIAIASVFIVSQRMLDRTYPNRPTAVDAAPTPESINPKPAGPPIPRRRSISGHVTREVGISRRSSAHSATGRICAARRRIWYPPPIS